MTRASVLIPIHNKPTTLPLTVDTVLRQSVEDLEVLLIGDGVTTDVRTVVGGMVASDERIRFLDLPKGPHHGERHRHTAIEAARSEAIFYLCDDDLLLPDHVADLLELLEDHDLVQSLNGWLTPAGLARLYPGDLADPSCVALHLRDDIRHNIVSITGTAHTRRAYLELDDPWDTTPAGQWPDHWQFRKLMRRPGFRGATSRRMTALQFPTSDGGRDTWTDEARLAEIIPWHALVTSLGGQEKVDRLVSGGLLPQLAEERVRTSEMHAALMTAYADLAAAHEVVRTHDGVLAGLGREIETLRGHVARLVEIRATQKEKIAALRARLLGQREELRRLRSRNR